MPKFVWIIISTMLIVSVASFSAGHYIPKTVEDSPEHTLLVCVAGDKVLYQGVVEDVYFYGTSTKFTEASGLTREIQNAACVLTRGTEAQWRAASLASQAKAAPTAGGAVQNDNNKSGASTNEVDEVDQAKP